MSRFIKQFTAILVALKEQRLIYKIGRTRRQSGREDLGKTNNVRYINMRANN